MHYLHSICALAQLQAVFATATQAIPANLFATIVTPTDQLRLAKLGALGSITNPSDPTTIAQDIRGIFYWS